MKIWIKTALTSFAVLATVFSGGVQAQAQDAGLQSLRGATDLKDEAGAVDLNKQLTGERFERNYRQQPPLVPHKISSYQIDLKANQCIGCHDWPQNTAAGAPKISETHYIGRNGTRLNHVSTARWFCTQCHVPQAEAKELVPNNFKSAAEMY